MSTQKSELPTHLKSQNGTNGHSNGYDEAKRFSIPEIDPYASPATYYGESHNNRKVAKARTYSAVGGEPRPVFYDNGIPRAPYTSAVYRKRWSIPNAFSSAAQLTHNTRQIDPQVDTAVTAGFKPPNRRQSHGMCQCTP